MKRAITIVALAVTAACRLLAAILSAPYRSRQGPVAWPTVDVTLVRPAAAPTACPGLSAEARAYIARVG